MQFRIKKEIKWEKLDNGKFKLNFHGSLVNGNASIGFVIRDENARVITMRGEKVYCNSVVGVEVNATRKGIT